MRNFYIFLFFLLLQYHLSPLHPIFPPSPPPAPSHTQTPLMTLCLGLFKLSLLTRERRRTLAGIAIKWLLNTALQWSRCGWRVTVTLEFLASCFTLTHSIMADWLCRSQQVLALHMVASYSLNSKEPASPNRTYLYKRGKSPNTFKIKFASLEEIIFRACILAFNVTLFLKEICPRRTAEFQLRHKIL